MLWTVLGSVCATAGIVMVVIKRYYPWLITDFRYLAKVIPHRVAFEKLNKNGHFIPEVFEKRAAETPDKVFIIYEGQELTYKEVNERANRICAMAQQEFGLRKKSVVALMMVNSVDFICMFVGLLKLGVVISMINFNLRRKALLHSLTVSDTNTLIIGQEPELIEAVRLIYSDLREMTVYVNGEPKSDLPLGFKLLQEKLDQVQCTQNPSPVVRQGQQCRDTAVFIFTSGTTGLPKPAIVTLERLNLSTIISNIAGMCKNDIMYVPFPLYHSLALIVGVCSVVHHGATCVLSRTFSKARFLPECRKYNVTVMLYIGEACRYLLTNEPSEDDSRHKIRIAIGNGLRQDIFATFKKRFNIERIVEFYASTEGTMGFINDTNVVGSCGRASPFLALTAKYGLYKWDVENECLVRDKQGLCVRVKTNEPGLLLSGIGNKQPFSGYKGQKELTESKIVRDVVRKGDLYFNSGDMMKLDAMYNIYFTDRVGDTFRWKGENVSTTEVSNLLTELEFIIDACVYGVNIPGYDGKAGMATLLLSPDAGDVTANMADLATHCLHVLPAYAIPMFVRIKYDTLEMTSTIKQTKVSLKQEGFDVSVIKDQVFYFVRAEKVYRELNSDIHKDISDQKVKF